MALFLTLASSAAPKFQSQQTSRRQSGDVRQPLRHPDDLRVREFVEVGGLIIAGPLDRCIETDDLPAEVRKSFDARVEAEAAFRADMEKPAEDEGHMPEDKFLL